MTSELEIQSVRFYEVSAKANEYPSEDVHEASFVGNDPGDNLSVEIRIRDESSRVGFRLTADYLDNRVSARIDCAVFFVKPEDGSYTYSTDDLVGFGTEHGIPILVPYLREALAESTRRITGKAATLGLVRVGDIEIPSDLKGSL